MKVAAGVILIIAALANLVGGAGYAFVGGVVAAGSEMAQDANNDAKNKEMTTEDAHKKFDKDMQDVKKAGGSFAGVGFFLLILGGLEIAAAVLLFMAKKPTFIRVVCVLEFVAIGLVAAVVAPPGIFAIIGAVGAILGLVAAGGIAKAAAEPAMA